MKPKTDGNTRDMAVSTGSRTRIRVKINHQLLNKWLTAEVINNLPDETAQAVADLIEAAVRRHIPAINAIYYVESCSTGGLVSFNRWLVEPSLNGKGAVKDVSEKQPEQQGD